MYKRAHLRLSLQPSPHPPPRYLLSLFCLSSNLCFDGFYVVPFPCSHQFSYRIFYLWSSIFLFLSITNNQHMKAQLFYSSSWPNSVLCFGTVPPSQCKPLPRRFARAYFRYERGHRTNPKSGTPPGRPRSTCDALRGCGTALLAHIDFSSLTKLFAV